MHALLSGQAAALVTTGKKPELYFNDDEKPHATTVTAAGRIFIDSTDVIQIEAKTEKEARSRLKSAWSQDRALRIFLIILDEEDGAEAAEATECLEKLLSEDNTVEFVEQAIFASPLPIALKIDQIKSFLKDAPHTLSLFSRLIEYQPLIQRVFDCYQRIPLKLFGGEAYREQFFAAATRVGASRNLVLALKSGSKIDFAVLKLRSLLRSLDNSNSIIESWTKEMGTSRVVKRQLDSEEADDFNWFENADRKDRGATFQNVMAQHDGIIAALKDRDLEAARKFANQLVAMQKQSSASEHLAKSLSNLAQQAKILGVPELQREWAEAATIANPADPRTFDHLADAYICTNQFAEAYVALEKAEAAGDKLFAQNGRARILRLTGKFDESRELYLKAISEFSTDPNIKHSLAAAADILRDMGRYEDALSEYKKLTELAPTEAIYWTGLASVLMDMGDFAQAIKYFGTATTHISKSRKNNDALVQKNGKATAYKLAGNFEKSIELYNQVISESPNDPVALSGLADVYRVKGDLEQALATYDEAIKRSPYTASTMAGKIEVLKEMGRYVEAEELQIVAAEKFPYDPQLAAGYASILKSQGNYSEALVHYDQNIASFPFNISSKLNRANILARMGKLEDSLNAYNEILASRPHYSAAAIAKAALLIRMRKFDLALQLLPAVAPRSQVDWSKMLLRSFLLDAQGDHLGSKRLLEAGAKNVPFARQRRLFKSALARLELMKGHPSLAVKVVEAAPDEITNVIRFHALAASQRHKPAFEVLNEIESSRAAGQFKLLTLEIARRFKVVSGEASQSRDWIFEAERDEILLAA